MKNNLTLRVTEIQRFCMHDGPGIRTTVFLKGCPLRCLWCHNPETQESAPQLLYYEKKCIGCSACALVCPHGVHRTGEGHTVDRTLCTACGACVNACPTGALDLSGKDLTPMEILGEIEKDRAFYGSDGGVTISGGEPFLQSEGAIALLALCKERGIRTAVETCGFTSPDVIRDAAPYVDLFLWDVKDTDDARHRQYVGASNARILENLTLANELHARIRLRCILVNGVNTDETHYERLAEIELGLCHSEGIELLPYHAYGGSKMTFLGKQDNGRTDFIPDAAELLRAEAFLTAHGARVIPSTRSSQSSL